jgi:ketosteroid isomerase-like protein
LASARARERLDAKEDPMSTRDVVRRYFDALAQKGTWHSFLSDDLRFTSLTSPVKEVTGKTPYLESTKRFFSMITSVEVRDLIVEGAKACALTRYQLQAPTGSRFQSDVAEILTLRGDKISSLTICFDTAPFPK